MVFETSRLVLHSSVEPLGLAIYMYRLCSVVRREDVEGMDLNLVVMAGEEKLCRCPITVKAQTHPRSVSGATSDAGNPNKQPCASGHGNYKNLWSQFLLSTVLCCTINFEISSPKIRVVAQPLAILVSELPRHVCILQY